MTMSHRKVHSHGSIPFSWEDSPGIRKGTSTQGHEVHSYHHAMPPLSSSGANGNTGSENPDNSLLRTQKFVIPPPPRVLSGAQPRRFGSGKGFWVREADPFLAAYKECTKDARTTMTKSSSQVKKSSSKFGLMNKLSCKSSSDVREDNFVSISPLPPLPRDRSMVARAIR